MKKKALIFALVAGLLLFGAVSSQAALIEFQVGGAALPSTVIPGAGSLLVDVVLTDALGVLDIDGFNLFVGASGAGALAFTGDSGSDGLPGYIFPNSFAFFDNQISPLQFSAAGSADAPPALVPGLLAQLTFDYTGNLGEVYTFGLVDTDQNFGSSSTGPQFSLDLVGNTQVEVVPIPGALLLLGSGLVGLFGLRRKLS